VTEGSVTRATLEKGPVPVDGSLFTVESWPLLNGGRREQEWVDAFHERLAALPTYRASEKMKLPGDSYFGRPEEKIYPTMEGGLG
jgi:hypothetical protein